MSENVEERRAALMALDKSKLVDAIENREYELEVAREEADLAATNLDLTGKREDRLQQGITMLGDIARALSEGRDAPTVEWVRDTFAGWVQRRAADPQTTRGQRDALHAALDALDDVIAGRMRVAS